MSPNNFEFILWKRIGGIIISVISSNVEIVVRSNQRLKLIFDASLNLC
jgi:hypothetical protein